MPRRIRRLGLLALVLLVIGAIALVLTARPKLEDEHDRADDRWTRLRAPLAQRYDQLAAVRDQLQQAGAEDRDVTKELTRALNRWADLVESSDADADTSAEAEAANDLEGLATRVKRTVMGSARLSTVQPLADALAAFTATVPATDDVVAYNEAAESYQRTTESARYEFVARIFGYDAPPALVLSG